MTEKKTSETDETPSAEWFLQGILTRLGEKFDSFIGRNWQPPSSIATSELTEKLRRLLDANVEERADMGKFVPHIIRLKTEWDKFSTDSQSAMAKLKEELHVAAIDHINDNRYHTLAPIQVEVKPDYFTKGVQLSASFDSTGNEAEMNVAVPQEDLRRIVVASPAPPKIEKEKFIAEFFIGGKSLTDEFEFDVKQRRSVGRSKECDLTLEDGSVSKIHATLLLNSERQLLVADTGSSNGTLINGNRIVYGKAHVITEGDKVRFGDVEVLFRRVTKPQETTAPEVKSEEPVVAADDADVKLREETAE